MVPSRIYLRTFLIACVILFVAVSCSLPSVLRSPKKQPATPPPQKTGQNQANGPATGGLNAVPQNLKHELSLTGQVGGTTYAVAVDGKRAYIGVGPRLMSLDISNPANPRLVGTSNILPGVVRSVSIYNRYAFVAAGKGNLQVLDLSDPLHLNLVSLVEDCHWPMDLARVGNLLYIVDNVEGLWIADISDPLHTRMLGAMQLRIPATSVAVSGNYAYLTSVGDNNGGSLLVVNVSDPSHPVQVAEFTHPGMLLSVRTEGDFAYLAAAQEGLLVVDISNPLQPALAGAFPMPFADGVAADGKHVYVTDPTEGIYVIDVSDPTNPSQAGLAKISLFGLQAPGERQVLAQNGVVYLANYNQGLRTVSVQDPANPRRLGAYDAPLPGFAFDSVTINNLTYVIEDNVGLRVVDVSDPTDPVQLSFDDGSAPDSLPTPRGLAVQGNYALTADINNGLRIFDVSKPAKPYPVGQLDKPKNMADVAVLGHFAYVVLHDPSPEKRGMLTVDIIDPQKPKLVNFLKLPNNAAALVIRNGYLFVADTLEPREKTARALLRVFTLSDPSAPQQVGQLDLTNSAHTTSSMAATDDYIYLGDLGNGLHVIDITRPLQPVEVGMLTDYGSVYDLAADGNYVYADCSGWVMVIDASNPRKPFLDEVYETSGIPRGIEKAGNDLFVADMDGGLVILTDDRK